MRSAQQIAQQIRAGGCPADRAFDRFLPSDLRALADQHWTPLDAATRAAQWLDDANVRTVVDIGSGAGKFCVAAALAGHCSFTGLEQRPRLVAAARDLARLFEVEDRVSFLEGVHGQSASPVADAYYVYNPFAENIKERAEHIDDQVELSHERYAHDVAALEDLLRGAAAGTYLLTYNGFGGRVPRQYREVRVDRELWSVLRLWRKAL